MRKAAAIYCCRNQLEGALAVHVLSMLVLALALSLDSFNVGTTYGLRNMNIPLSSITIIAACSGVMIMLSMSIGEMLENVVSQDGLNGIGGAILIVIGGWALLQSFRPHANQTRERHPYIVNLKIKKLGIVIRIIREPMTADMDQSGSISGIEAFLLGLALSFDAFGAGIGAALVGYPPVWTALIVSCMSALFLWLGKTFGFTFSRVKWIQKASFIPGVLLILLGVWRM